MTISLEKKLEQATVAKKRYRLLFVTVFILLLILLGIVYYNLVLDYAVLDHVKINREANSRNIRFSFDVIQSGRIDFNYGQAILTDRKEIQAGQGFQWNWDAKGETEVSIRSRQFIFPHLDKEIFVFD
ncbi:MAG: hypothetical protein RL637_837 [Pseudomonadota bacterium]|jgi:hypothetical protein